MDFNDHKITFLTVKHSYLFTSRYIRRGQSGNSKNLSRTLIALTY